MALTRFKSKGGVHLRGRVQPTLKMRPPLTSSPLVVSGYANPHKNNCLKEALHSLLQKKALEKVVVQSLLAFYNQLFLVPKPQNRWRPILDLSTLNVFLKVDTFKMQTPETIRLSLQQGEWVTSLDFSDVYFHIPISLKSRKFLRFHLYGETYQFTALPFGLAMAPLEFTKVVKEVKLMAQVRGIRIHQYLDDWLLRAPCREICLHHTQTLLALCQDLGWVVNLTKSELTPQQVFNFVGYRFDLSLGRVKPTQERWSTLSQKIWTLKGSSNLLNQAIPVPDRAPNNHRETGSVVQLRMRPLQWHLKNHWHVPEVLEMTIPLPRSLHPHLDWWLDEDNVLRGQPLHPKGIWSQPESKLHINFLELKAVFLALKEFEPLYRDQTVLVATDNTIVVAYINKKGGMRSGSLCALLVQPQANSAEGQAYTGSSECDSGQVVQALTGDPEWSLLLNVFDHLCVR